jgi:hypothetical protein
MFSADERLLMMSFYLSGIATAIIAKVQDTSNLNKKIFSSHSKLIDKKHISASGRNA